MADFKVQVCFTPGRIASYDAARTEQLRKIRGRFTRALPKAWKRQDEGKYHNKRSSIECIVALDREEIRQHTSDFAESGSNAGSGDANLFDHFGELQLRPDFEQVIKSKNKVRGCPSCW